MKTLFCVVALGILPTSKCSFCMAQSCQQSAVKWLAGQVRVLLKRVEKLKFEKENKKEKEQEK